jgi:hypothetical protein
MLFADVCAQFVELAPSDVDSKIENPQRVICESLEVDHSTVWQVSEENPDLLVMTHVYRDPDLTPLPLRPNIKEYFPCNRVRTLGKGALVSHPRLRCENLIGIKTLGSLAVGRNVTRQSSTDKPPALTNRFHSS